LKKTGARAETSSFSPSTLVKKNLKYRPATQLLVGKKTENLSYTTDISVQPIILYMKIMLKLESRRRVPIDLET
jgi:hypothetical protein